MNTQSLIDAELTRLAGFRQQLHRIPELGYEEFKTAAAIRGELDRLKVPHVSVPNAPTATIAMIGDTSRPCVALRADIDALPIEEKTGLAYSSTHPGRMHACGHDGHTTTLLGVAAVLKSMEKTLPVCVKLFWQPAEEGGAGGKRLVEAGILDGRVGPKVSAVFGLHGWPGMRVGMATTKAGPLLAATDNFKVTFHGKGCHGAYPHIGRDPIVAACEAVLNAQQIVAREVNPADSAVVTVGKINGGTAINVIPGTAVFEGTIRTLRAETRKLVRSSLERRCRGVAAANDCTVDVELFEGYPVTENDPAMADYVAKTAVATIGADRYMPLNTISMGGEDFSYYLEKVPGCFFLVGLDRPDKPSAPLHNELFDFADQTMGTGIRMFIELVLNFGK